MIVSHRHRFMFAAVPKTGTHSVRQALREQMGEEDIEQVGLFVNRRFPWAELAAIQHGHLSLRQVRPYLGEEAFAGYLKFAFVRNPFDRFVSYCAFMLRGGTVFQQRPRDAMAHFLFREPPEGHILFQPQSSLLVDDDGRTLLTDLIGRVEEMQASYDAICARIGITSRALDRVNGTSHGDYRRYYDQRLIEGVAARYARDLDLFGYTFEGIG
ncbi:sulfotransferase family 2 domain-containing protein [Sphingomonas sp. MMS24-J13]|uniref:sulfotransferase family 2 domain-containing protein n=1 Tax=Sphingomonas sp. MMS24-J13 TaxID=3238686 RepID=UPI003850A9FC